jgi:hypothetical protein
MKLFPLKDWYNELLTKNDVVSYISTKKTTEKEKQIH